VSIPERETRGLRRGVFITGGTGYIGHVLITKLLARGHDVRALVRPGSERKLPPGCTPLLGDALDSCTFAGQVQPADTLVHLVGVSHPSPAKAVAFREIDGVSGKEAFAASVAAEVNHVVYMSVAHPAGMMRAYIEVRRECESLLRQTGLNATILRPWYVLGPGHRWPVLLKPLYVMLELLPSTRPAIGARHPRRNHPHSCLERGESANRREDSCGP